MKASREEAFPPRDTPNEPGAFAVHHRGMLACHECDALQRRVPLQSGGMARCVRCGAVLYRRSRHGLEVTLALTFTAAVLFLLANAFPIVSLELQGQSNQTSLWGAVRSLWRQDMPLLAMLVFVTTLLLPALDLVAMLWVLGPLSRKRRPPLGARVLRALMAVKPWGMVEVFVLGLLVALVKLAHVAEVVPGIALWSFGGLMLVFAAAAASFDAEQAWTALDRAR